MVHVLGKNAAQAQTEEKPIDSVSQPPSVQEQAASAILDPLDHFVANGDHLAQVLWQIRHQYPNFTLQIKQDDLQAFSDCTAYLEVKPKVSIIRPQGRPALPAVAATAKSSARPAMDAEPPRDFVIIQMTDQAGNGFVPVENNEADFAKGEQTRKRQKAEQQIATLATGVRNAAAVGEFSQSDIEDLCAAALTLIR